MNRERERSRKGEKRGVDPDYYKPSFEKAVYIYSNTLF